MIEPLRTGIVMDRMHRAFAPARLYTSASWDPPRACSRPT
jgi:hypothetical protein